MNKPINPLVVENVSLESGANFMDNKSCDYVARFSEWKALLIQDQNIYESFRARLENQAKIGIQTRSIKPRESQYLEMLFSFEKEEFLQEILKTENIFLYDPVRDPWKIHPNGVIFFGKSPFLHQFANIGLENPDFSPEAIWFLEVLKINVRFLKQTKSIANMTSLPENSDSSESIKNILLQSRLEWRTSFIWEIHNDACYNGSWYDSSRLDSLIWKYDQYCDQIVIVADNILFSNETWIINLVRGKTKKPIIVLDFITTKEEVLYYKQSGATWIILVVSLLEDDELKDLSSYAQNIDMEVVFEVQDEKETERSIKAWASIIGINTRNISKLEEVDFEKIGNIRKIIPEDVMVIWESWVDMVSHFKDQWLDGWIIGSSILKSRFIEWSLEYFQKQKTDIPYIWLRPWAFLDNRLVDIVSELSSMGFELLHSVTFSKSNELFFSLKESLFRERPDIWAVFFPVISETYKVLDVMWIDSNYSELWFLRHKSLDTVQSYELLTEYKLRRRKEKEKYTYAKINVQWKEMWVEIHSIHVPDPNMSAHYEDLLVFSRERELDTRLTDFVDNWMKVL